VAVPVGVRASRDGRAWRVRVDTLQDLRALTVASVGVALLTDLEVSVIGCRSPQDWIGRPGLAHIDRLEVTRSGLRADVRLSLSQPADAARVLAAVLRMLCPTNSATDARQVTLASGLGDAARPLAQRVHDVTSVERDRHVRRADILVVAHDSEEALLERESTVVVNETGWTRDGEHFEVCVDPSVHNPIGRPSHGLDRMLTARMREGSLELGGGLRPRRIHGDVTEKDVASLSDTRAVVGEVSERLSRQLAACGIVVLASESQAPSSELEWQATSVRERRHALRAYGPWAAMGSWPSVSVVMSTHRPAHIDHALAQIALLSYPKLEVLIAAHGDEIDVDALRRTSDGLPHPVTIIPVDRSRNLGEALQILCTAASGDLITKMDDDDYYGPDHIWDLVLAREYSGAQVVGKALDWIHLEAQGVTVFRPVYPAESYADFVCGGTMLISRGDLASVGGWRPVPKSVDRALLDRVIDDGGLVYRTHGLGYVYVRRSDGHTATVSDEHFLKKNVSRVDGLVRHPEFGTLA
jgi:hypothetical protein